MPERVLLLPSRVNARVWVPLSVGLFLGLVDFAGPTRVTAYLLDTGILLALLALAQAWLFSHSRLLKVASSALLVMYLVVLHRSLPAIDLLGAGYMPFLAYVRLDDLISRSEAAEVARSGGSVFRFWRQYARSKKGLISPRLLPLVLWHFAGLTFGFLLAPSVAVLVLRLINLIPLRLVTGRPDITGTMQFSLAGFLFIWSFIASLAFTFSVLERALYGRVIFAFSALVLLLALPTTTHLAVGAGAHLNLAAAGAMVTFGFVAGAYAVLALYRVARRVTRT